MKSIKSFIHDWLRRWNIFKDKEAAKGQRACALLEFICMPVSMLTVLCIFVQFGLEKSSLCTFPAWWTNYAMRILSSAAIGYLTNWIAIEMLFKPFLEDKWHPFSIMTFGWWRQGMVPRNKAQIAVQLGEEVKDKLLNPDIIAQELCQMIETIAAKPETQERLIAQLQTIVKQNEQSIIDVIAPHIENSVVEQFDKLVKPETLMAFWTSTIEPKLKAQETRELIASKITDGLKRRSPQIIDMVKAEVIIAIVNYLRGIPFISSNAHAIATAIVSNINWKDWENKLNEKLAADETQEILREEALNLLHQFNDYLHSEEAKEKIDYIIDNLRKMLRDYISDYLCNQLPLFARGLISHESLAAWLRESLLPKATLYLKNYMQSEGKDLIVRKLDIAHRVENAVQKQDMEEFYEMVNSLAAQHLGAIQILGYVLGAIIGALQSILL